MVQMNSLMAVLSSLTPMAKSCMHKTESYGIAC